MISCSILENQINGVIIDQKINDNNQNSIVKNLIRINMIIKNKIHTNDNAIIINTYYNGRKEFYDVHHKIRIHKEEISYQNSNYLLYMEKFKNCSNKLHEKIIKQMIDKCVNSMITIDEALLDITKRLDFWCDKIYNIKTFSHRKTIAMINFAITLLQNLFNHQRKIASIYKQYMKYTKKKIFHINDIPIHLYLFSIEEFENNNLQQLIINNNISVLNTSNLSNLLEKNNNDLLKSNNNDEFCSICISSYEDEICIDCGHSFCLNCIKQWFNTIKHEDYNIKNNTCPLCRYEICQNTISIINSN